MSTHTDPDRSEPTFWKRNRKWTNALVGIAAVGCIIPMWTMAYGVMLRSDFSHEAYTDTHHAAHEDAPMPDNRADHDLEAERKLFLTPGGLYTQADIEANGRTVPSVKYADFVSAHNMNPRKGERICPITNTLANPKLTWIVGGKTYTFCCPPCLREFVQRAKTDPKSIRSPEFYVKH